MEIVCGLSNGISTCDLEWPWRLFTFETFLTSIPLETVCINYDVLESESARGCNFKCLVKTEELLKVTRSHVHSKSGNISETVQDGDFIATDH